VPLIDGGTQRLPRLVGLGRTLDITRTGRTGGDEEALAIGLVTELVEPGRHVERALELADALAGFPQQTMLAGRAAMLDGIGRPLAEGLEARRATARHRRGSLVANRRRPGGARRCGGRLGLSPSVYGTDPAPAAPSCG
jgi:enoyl-CoA hydratase